MQDLLNVVILTQGKALLVLITTSATFGLVILVLIMQAINYVRIVRLEEKILFSMEQDATNNEILEILKGRVK